AGAAGGRQLANDRLRRLLQRSTAVAEARGNREGGDVPDEEFAMTRRRDRAGRVVGIGAGADNRGVADPTGRFSRHSAGRGSGGEIAVAVSGDGAHGAVLPRLAARIFEGALQFAPTCYGVEIVGLAE